MTRALPHGYPDIRIGDLASCPINGTADAALGVNVIHACKEPCHRKANGYNPGTSSPNIWADTGADLYLNMIDSARPIFHPDLFRQSEAFAARTFREGRPLLIHCNQGLSRSPSIALFLLARMGLLPSASYAEARIAYEALIHPGYSPAAGIPTWLAREWERL